MLSVTGPAWSYDADMAASYAELFAPVKGAGAGKALHLMMPDAFLEKVKTGEPLVAVDIRTPAETGVFTVALPDALVKFRQGVGRLIRTQQDQGVITILDSRIVQKPYGRWFLASLPHPDVVRINRQNRELRFEPFI